MLRISKRGLATLVEGRPLQWEESVKHLEYVRKHGIHQFVNTWNRVKSVSNDKLLWGEETEMSILHMSPDTMEVKLSLRGAEVRDKLNAEEASFLENGGNLSEAANWMPEYGSWMVESTPKVPYSGYSSDLTRVETNMRRRRARLMAALKPNEIAPTITSFPMMGVGNFTEPSHNPGGPIGESKWIPDACTNPHPRFGALTQNIRKRRGSNVDIRVPIYIDRNTFAAASARRREMVTNIGHANPDRVTGLKSNEDETKKNNEENSSNDRDSAYDVWLAADDVVVMDHMAYDK